MSTMTGRVGSPLGESPLDARLCVEIGAALARAREARGLTLAQVSERLLLSHRQVKALEEVEFAAFHNATFHVNALRKYARLVDLDLALVDTIAASVNRPEVAGLEPSETGSPAPDATSRRGLATILAALALAGAVGVGGYFIWGRSQSTAAAAAAPAPVPAAPAPAPASPVPEAVAPPAVVTAAPASEPILAKTPAVFGTLRVLHPTWIFVRDADNMVTERSLGEGESFEFETQPTYLAVGTTGAELTIGTAQVDVARFAANGQIRIRAGDFDALVQGATPIQAPTAAGSPR